MPTSLVRAHEDQFSIWKGIDDTTAVMQVPGGMLVQTQGIMHATGFGSISISCAFVPDTGVPAYITDWIKRRSEEYNAVLARRRANEEVLHRARNSDALMRAPT